MLLGGLVLTGLGSILIAVSGALPPLLIGRSVQGVGSTLSWVAALALVSDLARPGRKGEAIGFALAANSLGAIGGPALGGIVGGEISFEAPFLLVSVIAAMIFTLGWIVLPRSIPNSPEITREVGRIGTLLRRSAAMPAAIAIVGAGTLGLVDFVIPLDLDRRLGTSATTIGLLFAAVALVDAATSPLAGRAGDRLGRRPVAFAGAAVMGASGLLLAVAGRVHRCRRRAWDPRLRHMHHLRSGNPLAGRDVRRARSRPRIRRPQPRLRAGLYDRAAARRLDARPFGSGFRVS